MEARDLIYIIQAHTERARTQEMRFRKWDRKTPYYIHSIWCATMILQETCLPEKIRRNGSQALLYHDIPEDTTAELPEWLSSEVKSLVGALTFSSSENEWENIWQRGKTTRLLKLYDNTNNFLDGVYMKPKRRQQHLTHLRKLCEDVERNYGELNVTRLARTFL